VGVLSVSVVRINKRYHARLFVNGELLSEWACQYKCDVGYICRQLLRWYDKTGGKSEYAKASRARGNKDTNATYLEGKIWGPAQLPIGKKR